MKKNNRSEKFIRFAKGLVLKFFIFISRLINFFSSVQFWLFSSIFISYSAFTRGVYLLHGAEWAYICAGACAMSFSFLIIRGIRRG